MRRRHRRLIAVHVPFIDGALLGRLSERRTPSNWLSNAPVGAKRKGKTMKIYRIALVAGLGAIAMALPAAAAPTSGEGTDLHAAKPALMQLAQMNTSRAINEARGGNYKKAMKKKRAKKPM
jgi:hypothetical protein